jgi:hypothetical protein
MQRKPEKDLTGIILRQLLNRYLIRAASKKEGRNLTFPITNNASSEGEKSL